MSITRGFGLTLDLARGTQRRWVMGRDGIKRWADDGKPVDPSPTGATAESLPLRLVGCHECGFGKVLGCWRCGGRQ
jgi:hypothetical protein